MDLFYENSRKIKVDFAKWPVMYQEPESLLEKEWKYDGVNYQSYGGKVKRFYRGIEEKDLKISIFANNELEFKEIVRTMEECFELDISGMTAGRLYYGKSYLRCFIFGVKWDEWEEDLYTVDQELRIVAEYPFWITEKNYIFHMSEILSTDNKKYPYKYALRYGNGMTSGQIINEHFLSCNFKLVIYGPCVNPQIIIGSRIYQIYCILESGEYITVDSMGKTVKKTMNNGTIVNEFNSRDKQNSIFQKVSPGLNMVRWPGDFSFDITLFEERSGPG